MKSFIILLKILKNSLMQVYIVFFNNTLFNFRRQKLSRFKFFDISFSPLNYLNCLDDFNEFLHEI